MSSEIRAALDTCVIVDILTRADPARCDAGVQLVKAAERGDIEIVLPAIVIAEVAGAPNIRGDNLSKAEQAVRIARARVWLGSTRFTVVDIDERVAQRAAELCHPYQLSGADSCVLAAAELWSCPDLYTWDNGLLKVGTHVAGVHVRTPDSFEFQAELEISEDVD